MPDSISVQTLFIDFVLKLHSENINITQILAKKIVSGDSYNLFDDFWQAQARRYDPLQGGADEIWPTPGGGWIGHLGQFKPIFAPFSINPMQKSPRGKGADVSLVPPLIYVDGKAYWLYGKPEYKTNGLLL